MAERHWETFQQIAYTLLRIVAAVVFVPHGAQKLFGAFGGMGGHPGATVQLFSLMGLAGFIEFFVGLCVGLGLFTRAAAFLASGEMASAFFMSHFPRGVLPFVNHGETPALLAFVFLLFVAYGPGPVSLDALLFRRRRAGAPVVDSTG